MKKIIAFILAVITVFSIMSISVYAEEAESTVTVTVGETNFVFDADTSEEFRSKFIAHYFGHDGEGAATYGLTCTLFGHDLESSIITAITHKVRATAPRCLRERYDTEACKRCDYANAVLIDATYIGCC